MKIVSNLVLVSILFLTASCNSASHEKKEISYKNLQEIIRSIKNRDSSALKQRLKGYDVNAFDSTGVNLLTHAVMTGDINIVKIIGDNDANPNLKNKTSMGSTPLMMSSEYKSLEIAKYLINKGADIDIQDNNGDPVINWSAYYGNIPFTKLMLENGAKTNLKSIHSDGVMQVALKEWQESIVELLLEKGITIHEVKNDSLVLAAKTNNMALTKELLNKNNLNSRDGAGNTILMIAAEKGYKELVEYLISKGSDIDAMNSVGQTALCNSVFFGKNPIAKFLIDEHADINKTDTRFRLPPLVAAVRSNNLEMGGVLLARGADVNKTDGINNFSPIMWATLYQNIDFVSLLLQYNPDLSIVSKYETNVFEMTEDKEILKLLNKE